MYNKDLKKILSANGIIKEKQLNKNKKNDDKTNTEFSYRTKDINNKENYSKGNKEISYKIGDTVKDKKNSETIDSKEEGTKDINNKENYSKGNKEISYKIGDTIKDKKNSETIDSKEEGIKDINNKENYSKGNKEISYKMGDTVKDKKNSETIDSKEEGTKDINNKENYSKGNKEISYKIGDTVKDKKITETIYIKDEEKTINSNKENNNLTDINIKDKFYDFNNYKIKKRKNYHSNNKKNFDNLFDFSNKKYSDNNTLSSKNLGFWNVVLEKILKQKMTLFSLILILLLLILSVVIPMFTYENSILQNLELKNLPPKIPILEKLSIFNGYRYGIDLYAEKGVSGYYLFGTDSLGRDIFSRVWIGIRTSLFISFIVSFIQIFLGSIIGGISGYFGGRIDNYLQRICEILGNIPTLIVVLILSLLLKSSIYTLIIALSIFEWIPFSRLVRAQILSYKNKEFVLASKALGARSFRIIVKDLLPNMLSTFIIFICMQIPAIILSEAYYTFIGVGLPAGVISLGQLIVENIGKFTVYPYQLYIPTFFMALISLTFNIIGNGLRDALDPVQSEIGGKNE